MPELNTPFKFKPSIVGEKIADYVDLDGAPEDIADFDGAYVIGLNADGSEATVRLTDGTEATIAIAGHIEDKVLIDVAVPSASTVNRIVLRDGGATADLTKRISHEATGVTADFSPYTSADDESYLGVRFNDPPLDGLSADDWYFHGNLRRARIVYLDVLPDPDRLRWGNGDVDALIAGPPVYVGVYINDEAAQSHTARNGDVYYNPTDAQLRKADNWVGGSPPTFTFDFLRLLTSDDLKALQDAISRLKISSDVEAYDIELGDQFRVVDVGTPSAYAANLGIQKDPNEGDRSSRMLLMRVTADITGSYQALADTSPQVYQWFYGDMLFVPPLRDDPLRINVLRLPDPSVAGRIMVSVDGSWQPVVYDAPELIRDLQTQNEQQDAQLLDMDLLSRPAFRNALASEAQLAAIPAGSALGQSIINTQSLDPTTIPGTTTWGVNVTLPGNNLLIARIEKETPHGEFRVDQTDANWTYFLVAQSGSRTLTLVIRRDTHPFHTEFHGQLGGRALAQVKAEDGGGGGGGDVTQEEFDGLENRVADLERDFLFEPNYWLSTADARTIIVHLNSGNVPAGATRIRLVISGATKTQNISEGDTDYAFNFTIADATNIRNNLRGATTISANLQYLDASSTIATQHVLLRVLAEAPSGGGSGGSIDTVARSAATAARTVADRAEGKADANSTTITEIGQTVSAALRVTSVQVSSPSEYQTALNAQRTNKAPIFLHITAAISGSRNTVPYNHPADSFFWVRPESDSPLIHLFTLTADENAGIVFDDTEGDIPPSQATLDRLRLYNGRLYRTTVEHHTTPTVTFRATDFGNTDLRAGETWAGIRAINPIPGPSTNGQVYYNSQLHEWDEIEYAAGPGRYFEQTYNNPAITGRFRGLADTEDAAKALVRARLDLVGVAGVMKVVSAYTQRPPDTYSYELIDVDLIDRIMQAEAEIAANKAAAAAAGTTADTALNTAETAQSGLGELTAVQTLVSAAEVDFAVDDGFRAILTLGHNVTLAISGGQDGDFAVLRCVQDATGNRTLTLGVAIGVNTAARSRPMLSTGSGDVDLLMFARFGTVWQYVGIINDA